jgi:hypothetical protein
MFGLLKNIVMGTISGAAISAIFALSVIHLNLKESANAGGASA